MVPKIKISKRQHVVHLLSDGHSIREVANLAVISKSSVHRIATEEGIDLSAHTGGRPRILSDRFVRKLVRDATSGRLPTAVDVAHDANVAIGIHLHPSTVRRAFRRSGLRAIRKKKRPRLSRMHRRNRFRFAQMYREFTIDDWKTVIWSDETKINRIGSDGLQWVWKERGSQMPDRAVEGTLKFGGGNIMVWGCMSWKGLGGYCRIEGPMDSKLYQEILAGELQQTISEQHLDVTKVRFQHDNDSKHSSLSTLKCLKKLKLRVLPWPSQSPDINPMEHVWRQLKRQLAKYPTAPSGVDELWERVQAEWQKVPRSFVRALIRSLPRRIRAVYRARGGHTKY
jgi:transposase